MPSETAVPAKRKKPVLTASPALGALSALGVKQREEEEEATPSAARQVQERKLFTLRLTYAQRRHLQKIAFDRETTVQDLIVSAINFYLGEKGLDNLDSVKA